MTASDDARQAIAQAAVGREWDEDSPDDILAATMPDGRTIAQHLDALAMLEDENKALRALVARFYTNAWEDPLTDDEMALLDPIVNEAVREADR